MKRIGLLVCLALTCGCAEETRIRTKPDAALVLINGDTLGISPVVLTVPSHSLSAGKYRYRVEKDGYIPKEGTIPTQLAIGRLVGSVFALGIPLIFHGVRTLQPTTDIDLLPASASGTAVIQRQDAASQKMRRIQNLYDDGLITEQEYKRYRSEVLRGIVDEGNGSEH